MAHFAARLAALLLPFSVNALATTSLLSTRGDDDPWERMKRVKDRGHATHSHFALHPKHDAQLSFTEDLVAATNAVRRRAFLPSMVWDPELATGAEEHAKTLCTNFAHSSVEQRHDNGMPTEKEDYIGENIYKVQGFDPTGTDVVDAWYAEIKDYTYGPVGSACTTTKCQSWPLDRQDQCMVGHFTQLMWHSSTQVGCGKAQCGTIAGARKEKLSTPAVSLKGNSKTAANKLLGSGKSTAKVAPAMKSTDPFKRLQGIFRKLNGAARTLKSGHSSTAFLEDAEEKSKDEDKVFAVSCRYKQGGNTVGDVPFDSSTAKMLQLKNESCTPLR
ncbi:unnamed protein product [Amoebophrya sp. A120]|nr:unnamed protein product [Amoebophrya sp. A120]|eukprot:GSA120T00022695001.1